MRRFYHDAAAAIAAVIIIGSTVSAQEPSVETTSSDTENVQADTDGRNPTDSTVTDSAPTPTTAPKLTDTTTLSPGDSVATQAEPAMVALDTMSVTARRVRNAVEDPLLESPALAPAISVVAQEEMQRQEAQTVVEALEYVPGAWTETRGRKVKSFVSVRAQKYPYPDYAVDGVWQREFEELPYFFPASQVDRIQVIRSSAALINGVTGLTGIINIVPKTYDSLGLDLEMSYGTFNTYRANVGHGNTLGDIAYAVGVGGMSTDGPEGKHAAEEALDFYGRAKWEPDDKLTVQANVFALRGMRELARIEWPGDTARMNSRGPERFDPYRALIANARTMYRWSDRFSTSLLLYYTRRNHDFYRSDTASEPADVELDWEWGANLIQAMSFFRGNVLRVSALYNNWVAPNGKRFYTGKKTALQTISAAIADEQTVGRFSVDVGVRWLKEYIDEYAAYNIEGTFVWEEGRGRATLDPIRDEWRRSRINATLGLAYALPFGASLFGHGAFGHVNPLTGMVDSTRQELSAEKQWKADIGAQAIYERLGTLTASGFYVFRKDGIAVTSQWDSIVVDDDVLALPAHENVDLSTGGVELELRTARFQEVAQAYVNAVFMNHRRRVGDELEADGSRPSTIVGGGLNLLLGAFDLNLYGKYVSAYESDRFAHRDGSTPVVVGIGDFSTVDLTAGYTYTLPRGQSFRVHVATDNLTDRRYSTVVGYPDFGRKVSIGLRYSY